MKNLLTILLCCSAIGTKAQTTYNSRTWTGTGSYVIAYDAKNVNLLINNTKAYADGLNAATRKYIDSINTQRCKDIAVAKIKDTIYFKQPGIKFDSIAKSISVQVYYDPITKTYKVNY